MGWLIEKLFEPRYQFVSERLGIALRPGQRADSVGRRAAAFQMKIKFDPVHAVRRRLKVGPGLGMRADRRVNGLNRIGNMNRICRNELRHGEGG